MAAINNATNLTVVTHHVNPEYIARMVRYAAGQRAYSWMYITHQPNLVGQSTTTYSHPILDNLAAASAHTETDEIASVQISRTNSTTSTAEYAVATALGDRAKRTSLIDEEQAAVNRLVHSIMLKVDNDALALASSMSNTQGDATTNNTLVNFNLVLFNFRDQIVASGVRPVMVMSPAAIRDLHDDAATNAAAIYGSILGAQLVEATGGTNQGIRRPFGGVDLIESSGVVAGDTTGKANFITLPGEDECGLVVPIAKDLTVEYARVGERLTTYVIASDEHGAGIADQGRCRRFITRA